MSMMAVAIGATSLSLLLVFVWMFSLSLRKQRLEQERKAKEAAYRRAIEKAREQERQERLFKAESGHIPTILFLAKEAERTNLKEALYWYNKGARLDNINCMYGIVRISERMREDMVLKEQANFWRLVIAGAEGNLGAKFEAGKALVNGRGVEKNIPKGYGLVEEAATEGNLDAMLFMGDWSQSYQNPDKSSDSAFEWYHKAADLGSVDGQIQLGLSYLSGLGTSKDHTKGTYWLERAAEKGSAEAMFHAGEAWRDYGKTGNALAYVWLFLASHFGYEKARAMRDQVATKIGVDIVVGLQSVAKPLMKKLEAGKVGKHSIIKALNKVYKRPAYFPPLEKPLDADTQLLSDDAAFEETLLADTVEVEQEPVSPNANSGKPSLDFSQSFEMPKK
ncbi:tetratricopeptide repeat protein [Vibrio navarrensis]|uniref:tetratricopeptide repeat protein n=1 Tax=Vibrio navarrensis TaxID=29495 RepID=UPI00338F9666